MIHECTQFKRITLDYTRSNEYRCRHCKTCPLCPSLVCSKHHHNHCKICLRRTNWYKVDNYNEKVYHCSIKCQGII